MNDTNNVESVKEGTLLWEPSEDRILNSNLTQYMRWLRESRDITASSYEELWQWSVNNIEAFWESIWDYFPIKSHRAYDQILVRPDKESMSVQGARWFTSSQLNYAEHILHSRDSQVAVIGHSEIRPLVTMTYQELWNQTAEVAAGLRAMGVRKGDNVVALMPNIPEILVAAMAVASIGAVWSSCPPEFGIPSVVDRFKQLEPKFFFAVDGYRYAGKDHDSMEVVASIRQSLPSVETTVILPYLNPSTDTTVVEGAITWNQLLEPGQDLIFEPVPFDHPLWVVYSSGTTGVPKAIALSHGGVLLEQFKTHSLHMDIKPDDRAFWFTTTGWVMWNILIGVMLHGAAVMFYDGSPFHPTNDALWKFAADTKMTLFGVSAPYIHACLKEGLNPGKKFNLSELRQVGTTGAPLSPEGAAWIYRNVGRDLQLGNIAGGTEMCTAFVQTSAVLPVHAGELQCRALGAKVEAFDPNGRPIEDEVGELVISEPMPSMPIHFINDPDGRRYYESYFDVFPGIWRHGDWMKVTSRGTCVIYGRSDSTLNRSGVRMGTSDFYRVVEGLPEVSDSLVVDTSRLGIGEASSSGKLLLFVVMRQAGSLTKDVISQINGSLRQSLSPRHVPDEIHEIASVPRTLSGKKLEIPVKRLLTGTAYEKAVSLDAMANPESMAFFQQLAGDSTY